MKQKGVYLDVDIINPIQKDAQLTKGRIDI